MRSSIHSSRRRQLRALLCDLRRKRHLTQVEVAEALDQSPSYVSKYESGGRRLDVVEFMDLCDALKIDPREVIGRLMAVSDPATISPPPFRGEG